MILIIEEFYLQYARCKTYFPRIIKHTMYSNNTRLHFWNNNFVLSFLNIIIFRFVFVFLCTIRRLAEVHITHEILNRQYTVTKLGDIFGTSLFFPPQYYDLYWYFYLQSED